MLPGSQFDIPSVAMAAAAFLHGLNGPNSLTDGDDILELKANDALSTSFTAPLRPGVNSPVKVNRDTVSPPRAGIKNQGKCWANSESP